MKSVVILSIFDWWYHSHGHSDMQLARALATRVPVLFVNSIGMRFPGRATATAPMKRIGRKLKSVASALRRPEPGLDLAVYTPVFWPAYTGMAGRLNLLGVRAQVTAVAARMGLADPVVIVTLPTYADVALGLKRSALFYNRSDRHADFESSDGAMIRAHEERLFAGADAVLYASQPLYEAEAGRAAGQAVLIGHGVDRELFAVAGPIAPDYAGIPGPRVGFFGDLRAHSIDFPLLEAVARACGEVRFVLGGTQLDAVGGLRSLPNVHFMPACPHEAMGARWRGLDAAILPYRLTPWQLASEPIKLNEILAMGLPVVGTALPALARRPGIAIAETAEAFAAAIRAVLARERTGPGSAMAAAAGIAGWAEIADHIARLAPGPAPAAAMPLRHVA